MRHLVITLLLLVAGLSTMSAQRRLVVADVETDAPVANASILGLGRALASDSLGRFSVPDSCTSLVVSHVNYESRIVNLSDLGGDTVFVISKLLNLQEVVVFGKVSYEDDGLDELRRRLRMARTEAQLVAADPSKSFGVPLALLAKLLPKKWRAGYKKARRKQHHQDVLREY